MSPGFVEQSDKGLQLLTRLRVLGGNQTQFRPAIQHALRNLAERIQIFSQQEHSFGTDSFHGQEFIRRFANALGQHHQLTRRRNLGGSCVLLEL